MLIADQITLVLSIVTLRAKYLRCCQMPLTKNATDEHVTLNLEVHFFKSSPSPTPYVASVVSCYASNATVPQSSRTVSGAITFLFDFQLDMDLLQYLQSAYFVESQWN